MIHYDTISRKMRTIAKSLFDNFSSEFYLAGGTALSLQIGHRTSMDLDYFINAHLDTPKLKNLISEVFKNNKVNFVFEEKDTLWCLIDGLKISFISRFDNLLENILVVEDFRLAQIKDITVMKLSAICAREEYKDYFDLACIATITDARSWRAWWQEMYKNSDPISFMIALSSIDQILEIKLDIKEEFKNINPKIILSKVTKEMGEFFK